MADINNVVEGVTIRKKKKTDTLWKASPFAKVSALVCLLYRITVVNTFEKLAASCIFTTPPFAKVSALLRLLYNVATLSAFQNVYLVGLNSEDVREEIHIKESQSLTTRII